MRSKDSAFALHCACCRINDGTRDRETLGMEFKPFHGDTTMRWFKRLIMALLMLALIVGGGYWWRARRTAAAEPVLKTSPVKRGTLVAMISATGTVEPEEVVDVGAQVAGQIINFGKDAKGEEVDYGSPVEAGTVLAQIDDALYSDAVAQAQANLDSAAANVLQMEAKLTAAQRDWDRVRKFPSGESVAATVYDQYLATLDTAKASLAAAQAAVAQMKAALHAAQRNLAYCTIKAPVKGVVIDRRVNIGQTVVSSLSAPSLFLLAKDLRRIQVWVSVNEADIGHIVVGSPATFSVDAFPGQEFHGTVGKVRLNATMTQNVVTYTVEVNTDNPDGRLLPYLTANVKFEVGRRNDVLMVPNVALRWWPEAGLVSPDARSAAHAARTAGNESEAQQQGTLWIADGKFVKPLEISAGLTDGTMTEVSGAELKEGMEVVVGQQTREAASAAAAAGASPFTPRMGRR